MELIIVSKLYELYEQRGRLDFEFVNILVDCVWSNHLRLRLRFQIEIEILDWNVVSKWTGTR